MALSSCSSSVPLPSLAESDGSSWDDVLWQDIDLAERYLVSSQFNEAAALSSTILRKLVVIWESSKHGMHNDIDDNEMEGIMEAAGMVLVQAYSESCRKALIFKDLETIFGCTAKVPSSVLLAGLCLQISARLYLEAQLSVESFLRHWSYTQSNQQFCTFKPKLGDNHNVFRLNFAKYTEIDLYCVELLAKGLGRLDLAVLRVKESDIPAERKQDMHVSYHDKVTSLIPESGEYFSGFRICGNQEWCWGCKASF